MVHSVAPPWVLAAGECMYPVDLCTSAQLHHLVPEGKHVQQWRVGLGWSKHPVNARVSSWLGILAYSWGPAGLSWDFTDMWHNHASHQVTWFQSATSQSGTARVTCNRTDVIGLM
jgi:hypothetical protein